MRANVATDRGRFTAPNDTKDAAEVRQELRHEAVSSWPVNWTGIFVGALASIAAVILFGLIGVALGAHTVDANNRVVDLRKMGIATLIFSVCAAFFSFVIGGWVCAKVAGIYHSESGSLHGAITWLTSIPAMILMIALGAGSLMGGWAAGLSGTPSWATASATTPFERPDALSASATAEDRAAYDAAMADYNSKVRQWREDTPKVTRNTAIGAATALLLGLMGAVLGGWMASGEPMNFTHHRNRNRTTTAAATS